METTPIIELQEWLAREGLTYPAMRMPMPSDERNYFTIDGEACPTTGSIHQMHIHGGPEDAG